MPTEEHIDPTNNARLETILARISESKSLGRLAVERETQIPSLSNRYLFLKALIIGSAFLVISCLTITYTFWLFRKIADANTSQPEIPWWLILVGVAGAATLIGTSHADSTEYLERARRLRFENHDLFIEIMDDVDFATDGGEAEQHAI